MSSHDIYVDEAIRELEKYIGDNRHLNSLILLDLFFDVKENTYLHIASGTKGVPFIEAFKVQGAFYIPYSSIKGALRRIGETIAKSSIGNIPTSLSRILMESHVEPEGEPIVHRAHHQKELAELMIKILNRLKGYEKGISILNSFIPEDEIIEIEQSLKKGLLPYAIEPILSALCPICRLLGGPGISSKILIRDVKVHGESITRTHIGINRKTNTVEKNVLFTLELVQPKELSIKLTIINVHPETIEAKILAGILKFIKELGFWIGGRKSIGLGRIYLDEKRSKARYIRYQELETNTLKEYLLNPEKAPAIDINQLIRALGGS